MSSIKTVIYFLLIWAILAICCNAWEMEQDREDTSFLSKRGCANDGARCGINGGNPDPCCNTCNGSGPNGGICGSSRCNTYAYACGGAGNFYGICCSGYTCSAPSRGLHGGLCRRNK
jgi:hypothetical protein